MATANTPLIESDLQSGSWGRLKKHWQERLAKLRALNDNDLGDTRTARLRGQIAELRYNLSLGEPRPLAPPEDVFKD